MKGLSYLLAAAAFSGLTALATPISASPLAGGLTDGKATVLYMNQGSVQNVGGYDHGYYDEYPYDGYYGGYPNVVVVPVPVPGYVDDYNDYYDHYDHGYGHHHKWRRHHHRHHKWKRHHHGHHKWKGY